MSGYRGSANEWPQPEIDTLKKLWTEGKSASEIARAMPGRTRNAVIGKVHRLKLEGRGQPSSFTGGTTRADGLKAPPVKRNLQAGAYNAPKVKPVGHRPPKPGPQNKPALVMGAYKHKPNFAKAEILRAKKTEAGVKKVASVTAGAGVESPNAKPWMERRFGECAWPLGERGEALSCCNPVKARGWCAGHYAIGTAPTQPQAIRSRDASRLTRFDRVERDVPRTARVERTLWDDARLEAA